MPTDEVMRSALEAGYESAEMALRIGRADLASGGLDGVGSILMAQERFSDCMEVVERRLELLDRIDEPMEIGDILSIAAWLRFDMGMYEEAVEFAEKGYERTVDTMRSSAVHSQAWLAIARFRLGEWDRFLEDFDVLERLLGDRRSEPPYFAVRPFGPAAFVHEVRGERPAADRVLAVVEGIRVQEEGRGSLALAFASLVYARRGELDVAWNLSDQALFHRLSFGPAVWEARCDLVAESGEWDRAPETLASAREAIERGRILALPAFADRLEGRAALVEGDPERATQLLERAGDRFGELHARWERACTDLSLAEAMIASGNRGAATARLESALALFRDLRSWRETARSEELLRAGP
jgi:tetratricopeptide (TPR) repeat protein